MDVRELRKEIGKTPAEELLKRVLDELAKTQSRLRRVEAENERLRKRLAQYEPEVAAETPPASAAESGGRNSASMLKRSDAARSGSENARRAGVLLG